VVFDFGNTLAKSASLETALINVVNDKEASVIGLNIENEICSLYKPDQRQQPDWKDIWERAFINSGLTFTEEVGRRHLEEFCRLNETFPQVPELLSELKKTGIKLGLLSNATGPSEIFQNDLVARGLAKYFDSVIWSSAIGYRKPYRKAFEAILTDLNVLSNEVLMVGDSEIADIGGASNLKIDTVLISRDGNLKTNATYQVAIDTIFNDIMAITSNEL